MRNYLARLFARECRHDHALVVTSVGVRRTICEDCGHISFKLLPTTHKPYIPVESQPTELPHAEGL